MSDRVGRNGFAGSPITDWCDGCQDYVVQPPRGRCLWCCGQMPTSVRRMTEQQIRAAHRTYEREQIPILEVALRYHTHDYFGYRTATDLKWRLRAAWVSRGLELRTQQEAANEPGLYSVRYRVGASCLGSPRLACPIDAWLYVAVKA